jgi:hypothetical protein
MTNGPDGDGEESEVLCAIRQLTRRRDFDPNRADRNALGDLSLQISCWHLKVD